MNVWWERLCGWWQGLMGSDFASGYWLALCLMGSFFLLWLVIHLIVWLLFRRRRAASVTIRRGDGDIEITDQAIFQCVRALEGDFPRFAVQKIKLYRKGSAYALLLEFEYAADRAGLAEEIQKFKQQIFEQVQQMFDLRSIRKINFKLAALKHTASVDHDLDHVGVR